MKRIPIEQFGRDHWCTLAYIETVCVDLGGIPEKDRMRANPNRHFALMGVHQKRMCQDWQESWATRIKGHTEDAPKRVAEHDDWDCVDDLEKAGLLVQIGTGLNPCYQLTELGETIANLLRKHKARGGTWSNFDHTAPLPTFKHSVTTGMNTAKRKKDAA